MCAINTQTQPPTWTKAISELADQMQPQWVQTRRHLHQQPELSDHEYKTTQLLASAVASLDLPHRLMGDGRGLTADLVTHKEKVQQRIAVRGDIDALPIDDLKTVAYKSTVDGVMHACGHDAHATIVLGAMQILTAMHKNDTLPWPIAVRAIFQPAEEKATGAPYMIHHHALRDIDAIVALHVDPVRSVGSVGLKTGVLTAAADLMTIEVHGSGGHGARPHLTRDPIEAATHWAQSAYRRLSRTTNPHRTTVFSIGEINAGHSPNVIPDSAIMTGTLRSLDKESRQTALETLEDVCDATSKLTGCEVKLTLDFSAPSVVNDTDMVQLVSDAALKVLGPASVEMIPEPSMGSEDFSYYLERIPGVMFRLGIAGDQVGNAPLHTPNFDIDERALAVGAKLFAASVIDFFDPEQNFRR